MKGLLYVLLQCTWGLLQTAAGVAVLLWYRKCPHSRYHSAVVTVYPLYSSLSLGPFIFLSDKPPRDRRGLVPHGEISRRLLVHEYGHTVQSLLWGRCTCRQWACPPPCGLTSPPASGNGEVRCPISAFLPKKPPIPWGNWQ